MKRLLGNSLIIGSLILLTYIYLPFINAYFPSKSNADIADGDFILIPRISAIAEIIPSVDPWNEAEYKIALKKGVAQAKDNPNFYFAHSSLDPWEMTRENTSFLRLGELNRGDQIKIYHDGKEQIYSVTGKKIVWPSEVDYLKDPGAGITLQTCTPIGTSLKRLLVFATPL